MIQAKTTIYDPALSGNPQSGGGRVYPNGNPNDSLNPPGARNTDSVVPLHSAVPVMHDYHCGGPAAGTIGFRWIYGSNIAARNRDPRVQVMQYNEDTYLMRENICVHWEGPFTYLLFGNDGALLIDTGATKQVEWYPLRKTVDAIVARWAKMRGRVHVPLTVVMTSGEDIAQNQGYEQFVGRPDTVLAPKTLEGVKSFYKLEGTWPAGAGAIDLGGRVIEVLATPGTHRDGVSFYDPYCDLLFTGDFLYPGKIQISNDADFVQSLTVLATWKKTHPVKWILGGHVEMQFLPGKAYPRFYTYKPYERVLQMEPGLIDEALQCAKEVVGKRMVLVRPDFHLLNGVSPDQKTTVFPAGVPNITAPRPF
jgi:glyoxylase-like metal-dependent hydrolase (beta-lactamase superfamily II)